MELTPGRSDVGKKCISFLKGWYRFLFKPKKIGWKLSSFNLPVEEFSWYPMTKNILN